MKINPLKMKNLYKIILFTVILGFTSCLEDLDFDQAEDLEIEPTIAIDLLDFNVDQNDLLDLNVLNNIGVPISDQTSLPDLQNSFFQEDVEEVELQFRANNEFDEDFTVEFTFWDENGNPSYIAEPILIPANEANFIHQESIVILNNPLFLTSESASIEFTFEGTNIDNTVDASLSFSSAAVLYTSIDL